MSTGTIDDDARHRDSGRRLIDSPLFTCCSRPVRVPFATRDLPPTDPQRSDGLEAQALHVDDVPQFLTREEAFEVVEEEIEDVIDVVVEGDR